MDTSGQSSHEGKTAIVGVSSSSREHCFKSVRTAYFHKFAFALLDVCMRRFESDIFGIETKRYEIVAVKNTTEAKLCKVPVESETETKQYDITIAKNEAETKRYSISVAEDRTSPV